MSTASAIADTSRSQSESRRPNRRDQSKIIKLPDDLDLQLRRLALPEAYGLMPARLRDDDGPGRPLDFPPEFWSALSTLRREYPSVSKLHKKVAGNKILIAAIWDGVLKYGTPRSEAEHSRWRRNREQLSFPCLAHAKRMILQPKRDPLQTMAEVNTAAAVEIGYFQAHAGSAPTDRGRVLTADGTVYGSPSSNSPMDPASGRSDPMTDTFTQGGREKVWGPKFTLVSVQALDHWPYGITLAACHVQGRSPAQEADKTVDLIEDIDRRLLAMHRKATAAVNDGAFSGKHVARLAAIDMGAISRPAKAACKTKGAGSRLRTHLIGDFQTKDGVVRLALRGAAIVRLTNVAGQSVEEELEQRPRVVTRMAKTGIKQYPYVEVVLDAAENCTLLVPLKQMDGQHGRPHETATQYLRRMSLMRFADPDSEQGIIVFRSNRGTAENNNSAEDEAMPHKRIPAYGQHRQECYVADRKISQALDLLAAHRIRNGDMSEPGYPRLPERLLVPVED